MPFMKQNNLVAKITLELDRPELDSFFYHLLSVVSFKTFFNLSEPISLSGRSG